MIAEFDPKSWYSQIESILCVATGAWLITSTRGKRSECALIDDWRGFRRSNWLVDRKSFPNLIILQSHSLWRANESSHWSLCRCAQSGSDQHGHNFVPEQGESSAAVISAQFMTALDSEITARLSGMDSLQRRNGVAVIFWIFLQIGVILMQVTGTALHAFRTIYISVRLLYDFVDSECCASLTGRN